MAGIGYRNIRLDHQQTIFEGLNQYYLVGARRYDIKEAISANGQRLQKRRL